MYFLILHCVAAKESSTTDDGQRTKRFSWEVLFLSNLTDERKLSKNLFKYVAYYVTRFLSGMILLFLILINYN